MNGPLTGWRVLLRIAWRDVLRNKGRSALILVMIALPVLGVTAAHAVISTADVNTVEGLDRRIGTADALLEVQAGGRVIQGADPHDGGGWAGDEDGGPDRAATPADIADVLGPDTKLVPWRQDWVNTVLDSRLVNVSVMSADLREPAFDGMWELTSGRVPERTGEILVNQELVDRGVAMGDTLDLPGAKGLEVVGEAEDAGYRGEPSAWAFPGSLTADPRQRLSHNVDNYLVETEGGVDWTQVRALNAIGVQVLSRDVVADPPSKSQLPEELAYDDYDDRMIAATVVLVVTMALLEVILLAGPAFAVGARRMQRHLAQVAATGGTPAQVRRAVLATAVVLGGIAAGIGLLGGILVGRLGVPIAQHFDKSVFGPFDLVWTQLLGIALLGWISAVVAAFVPAWIASRQDVVKVLAGRRGDRAPSKASPVVGAALFAAGVGVAVHGTRQNMWGEVWVAGSAVLVVVGAVLLLSPVVALVSRFAGRAPLPLRYAARDAARHRARTVPAIGAVMATVTGVVALGIANASDAEQSRETYQPSAALGAGYVSYGTDSYEPSARPEVWKKVDEVTLKAFPGASVVRGLRLEDGMGGPATTLSLEEGDGPGLLSGWSSDYGQWVVSDTVPDADLGIVDADERKEASTALAAGKLVLFTDGDAAAMAKEMDLPAPDVDLTSAVLETWKYDGYGRGKSGPGVTVPATVVEVDHARTTGILPTAMAARFGVPVEQVAISVPGPVSKAEEQALEAALGAAGVPDAGMYVERGYSDSRETLLMLLVLAAVGGLLMVGGTLTATFLALSDAAPDLATLSAVGAAPRERRLVAACYALVVGGVGAVLGALVGLVPGIAATWPMTGHSWEYGAPSHYLDIPWLLILGVVVGLPLLTALVVGLCARSRLPLVARID
ncbi:ABC transporter permease [Nocardioides sp.]|uniref:ABC transporter permease n=1 Tax=Nocardioides sp. TaxID=35761 RepID=UPI002B6D9634|nr:ABC transporter permease [Nocardioides sp.]HSX67902.1 ABC transporter permease [Nocardioides sp.]